MEKSKKKKKIQLLKEKPTFEDSRTVVFKIYQHPAKETSCYFIVYVYGVQQVLKSSVYFDYNKSNK
jgi:hypothetical protein